MKKIAIILLTITLLTGCGGKLESIVSEAPESTQMNSKFDRHRLDDNYSILVEKESGICYLEYYKSNGYQGFYGITIMLNPDGTPKIWEGYND